MVAISEWLPNPLGKDAEGEWVELWNSGGAATDLSGWKLVSGKSEVRLRGKIEPNEYLVLKRQETKLSLPNQNASLRLVDGKGSLVDRRDFKVTAPEGKSYARTKSGNFLWAVPSPGGENQFEAAELIGSAYPSHVPAAQSLGVLEASGLAVGTGAFLAVILLYIILKNEDLSKLLFGGDQEIR